MASEWIPAVSVAAILLALFVCFSLLKVVDQSLRTRRKRNSWLDHQRQSWAADDGVLQSISELGWDLDWYSRDRDDRLAELADLKEELAVERRQRVLAQQELALRPAPHPIVTLLRRMGHQLTLDQIAHGTGLDRESTRRQGDMLCAAGQLEGWLSEDGPATAWALIGYRLPATDQTQRLAVVAPATAQMPRVRVATNGAQPALSGGW